MASASILVRSRQLTASSGLQTRTAWALRCPRSYTKKGFFGVPWCNFVDRLNFKMPEAHVAGDPHRRKIVKQGRLGMVPLPTA